MITAEPSNKLYFILKLNRLLLLICLFSIMLIITSLIFIVFKALFILILTLMKLIRRLYFNKVNNNNEECSICLEPMDKNTIVITYCNHTFHDDCIKKMLDYNNKCPLCRRIL
jgi:hypothetical protein